MQRRSCYQISRTRINFILDYVSRCLWLLLMYSRDSQSRSCPRQEFRLYRKNYIVQTLSSRRGKRLMCAHRERWNSFRAFLAFSSEWKLTGEILCGAGSTRSPMPFRNLEADWCNVFITEAFQGCGLFFNFIQIEAEHFKFVLNKWISPEIAVIKLRKFLCFGL